MNLVPIAYKKYYVKQRNKKIAFILLLNMSLLSLGMSICITIKRENLVDQLAVLNQLLQQGDYESMVETEERILRQEQHLEQLDKTSVNLQSEKLNTLRHLEYLKPAYTNALHIQGYVLNEEIKTLDIKGYADTKSSLLDYIEAMKESSYFKEVTFDTVESDQEGVLFTIWIEME